MNQTFEFTIFLRQCKNPVQAIKLMENTYKRLEICKNPGVMIWSSFAHKVVLTWHITNNTVCVLASTYTLYDYASCDYDLFY